MAITDIFLRFKKHITTSGEQRDHHLKTHYYKESYSQLFQSVEEIIRQDAECRITTVSKEHGKIAVDVRGPVLCSLVVTLIAEKPSETAVDLTISSDKCLLGNYSNLRQRIISFYERLNMQHTLIGTH